MSLAVEEGIPASTRRSHGPALLIAGLVAAAFLASFGALHYGLFTRGLLVDTPLYERYGDLMVHHGELPYRDFSVEYPPAALPVFAAPSLLASQGAFPSYARWFEVEMLLCGAAAAAVAGTVLARRGAGLAHLSAGTLMVGLAPLALGPVVLSRYDLWPAALTVGAVAALAAGRARIAFAVLGLAVAAKGYPVVLAPLFVIETGKRRRWREAAVGAMILAAVVGVCVGPFLWISPHGVLASLAGQANRPLQIESLGGSVLLAAHQLWGTTLTETFSHGSNNLAGALPDALGRVQSVAALAAQAAIWVAFARGPLDRERLLRYAAAAVCAFVALDKVLSPQYLIWLMALVPLVRGRRGIAAAALFLAAMLLTQLWFPHRYLQLVDTFDPRVSWLVVARDLILVALLVVLAWPTARARAAGVIAVAPLLAAGAAAAAMAATSSAGRSAPIHTGLLVETGRPTSCRTAPNAPTATAGTVRYETITLPNPGASACVSVALSTQSRAQLFSAAYRTSFDPTDPRVNYLGDAGLCTNMPEIRRPPLAAAYAFRAPRHRPFVIEVEDCAASPGLAPYTLDVTVGGGSRVHFTAASARRSGDDVVIAWQATRAAKFSIYRQQNGTLTRVGSGSTPFRDRGAGGGLNVRYWIRAAAPDGGWQWRGPLIAADGVPPRPPRA